MWQGLVGGIVITVLNLIGALAVLLWRNPTCKALDTALGFAAGGMLYVISDEIIPKMYTRGEERAAPLGTMVGILVLLALDVALGRATRPRGWARAGR